MVGGKKQLISVRLCNNDVERIRVLASRLHVRESDVIRFALRLAPLLDEQARGRDLIPIFLECGPELTYHFDLEPRTLEAIINDGLDNPEKKVDSKDIELIATLHLPSHRLPVRFKALPKVEIGRLSLTGKLQQYLYSKYVHPGSDPEVINDGAGTSTVPRRNRVTPLNVATLDEGVRF